LIYAAGMLNINSFLFLKIDVDYLKFWPQM